MADAAPGTSGHIRAAETTAFARRRVGREEADILAQNEDVAAERETLRKEGMKHFVERQDAEKEAFERALYQDEETSLAQRESRTEEFFENRWCDEFIENLRKESKVDFDGHSVAVHYMGELVPCNHFVLSKASGVFRTLIEQIPLGDEFDGKMPMICPPESLHCPSVKAFKFVFDGAVLQNWRGASVWEPNTSFFTYTKLWLIARDWDMPEMLAAAQFNMADLAIDLSLRGSYLLGAAELDRQSKHLASFVQSAMLASSLAGDAPAIYAGLVDLGSMLAGKLSWCPSLKDWAAERGGDGEAFARDIGAM